MSKIEDLHITQGPVEGEKDVVSQSIPVKYRGTAFDHHDMSMLGKKQVLRRQFKFSTMLGLV
jgi:hypothetical protein